MSDYNLKRLENAVSYAMETGSFCIKNVIKNSDYFCIWGAGNFFTGAYERWFTNYGIHADYVVDRDDSKIGKIFFNRVPCISPEQLFELKNPVVMPLLGNDRQAVIEECESSGLNWINPNQYFFEQLNMQDDIYSSQDWFEHNKDNIFRVYHMLHDEDSKYIYSNIICNYLARHLGVASYKSLCTSGQYFEPEKLFHMSDNECFLDVGAFNGDSLFEFLNIVDNNFDQVYCFEMSKDNYTKLKKVVDTYPSKIKEKIICYHAGAWNENTLIRCGNEMDNPGEGAAFSISKGKGNFLKHEESEYIKCVRLDSILEKKKVTLLKMDIEGAEQAALDGARQIIIDQKPKLAVCIYHSLKDLWEIPILIKKILPEYHIAIRHHTTHIRDTVCYAWI